MQRVRSTLVSSLLATAVLLAPGVTSAAPYAYVSNWSDDSVSVIDLAINTVIRTIPVENKPREVVISHDGARAYVANYQGSTGSITGSISVIDTATNSVVDTWPACAPAGLAINGNDSILYYTSDCWTADNERTFVRAISADDGSFIATIEVGFKEANPHNMAFSLDGSTLYVVLLSGTVAPGRKGIVKIDTASHTRSGAVITDDDPGYIAMHPDGTRLYVGYRDGNSVAIFDTATDQSLGTITVGNGAGAIAVNTDASLIYVANSDDNTVSVINANTNMVTATIPVGTLPTGVAFSPRGDRAYVPCYSANLVSVIDTATSTVINNVLVGANPLVSSHFITPASAIYVDPSHHDFGDVSVGQTSATQNIMIHNEGSAVMDLGQILLLNDTDDQFNIDLDLCSNNTLASNGSCGITVSFSPTSYGDKTANIGIPSDDPNSSWLYVSLAGSARAPQMRVVGYSSPLPNEVGFSLGAAEVNETVVLSRLLSNEGNETLHIGTIGGLNPLAAPFGLAQDNCSNMDLLPGSTCELIFSFAPTVAGHQNDTFDLPSDDPTHPNRIGDARGWASALPVGNIRVFDDVEPFDDGLVPFGEIAGGDSATIGVFLFNIGSINELTVSAIRLIGDDADQFAFDPTAAAVDACGALPIAVPGPTNLAAPPQLQPHPCEVTVTFAPTSAGDKVASLEIDSNDPDEATVTLELSGRVLAPMIQVVDNLDYGPVPLQTPVLRQVTVENSGTTDLTISNIGLDGDSDFALQFDAGTSPCTGSTQIITPAHACTFTVLFTPVSEASLSATVTISNDDPNLASATVALTGEGFQHGLGDNGDPDSPGDDGGCDCSGAAGPWALPALLVLLRRRRCRDRTPPAS